MVASSSSSDADGGGKKSSNHHVRIDSDAFDYISKELGIKDKNDRLVVVRYFLDRPGYDLHNSAARLWFHPPRRCKPGDVQKFLAQQRIALPGLLVEVYLDKYKSFMLLEACEVSCIEWNFETVSKQNPGILNIRLTDLSLAEQEQSMSELDKNFFPQQRMMVGKGSAATTTAQGTQYANPTPAGLFSFSMMVGLETVALAGRLFPGTVDPSFALAHGPYMLFVGGLLQIFVASFNVLRNNLYGATAFFGFGCFWFANGLTLVLKLHFSPPDTEAGYLLDNSDPLGLFFRSFFVLIFSMALLKQTFVMSRLSTTLIGLLCLKVASGSLTGWSKVCEWIQLVTGALTSVFAFYVFLVEFTNGVYHRDVFPTFKWSTEHSPEEVFGAAGRSGTLFSKAARLRQARFPDVPRVRGAMDEETEKQLSERTAIGLRGTADESQENTPVPTAEED